MSYRGELLEGLSRVADPHRVADYFSEQMATLRASAGRNALAVRYSAEAPLSARAPVPRQAGTNAVPPKDVRMPERRRPPQQIYPGQSLDGLMTEMDRIAGSPALSAGEGIGRGVMAGRQWFDLVRPDGKWDFKTKGRQYEAFGNEAYGATGRALGLPDWVLRRGAGWAQERYNKPGEGYDPSWGHWWGGYPYGDDPYDQKAIERGIRYHDSRRPRR